MAVRQYIGARYVPIFGRMGEESIQWDNTGTYEPLTVVLYQGNSYTSRQFVPVGIDITNEAFWAETGNYNAQVEQYRQEVMTFDDAIEANTEAIGNLRTDLGTLRTDLEGDMSALEDSVNDDLTDLRGDLEGELQTVRGALESEIAGIPDQQLIAFATNDYFNGAKSIGFGDSNMAVIYLGNGDGRLGTYGKVCSALGCTYDNRGVSGARFNPAAVNNIPAQIDAATADGDVRLVMLIGGINDFHYETINYTNFLSYVRSCINKCVNKFPNAAILVMFDQGSQSPSGAMLRYGRAVAEAAAGSYTYGRRIASVFTSDMWMSSANYYNTNHYSESGTSVLAARAINALMGVSLQTKNVLRTVVTPESGFSNCHAIVKTTIDHTDFHREDDVDVFFDTDFAYTGGDTVPNTPIFKLPFGFDSNRANGSTQIYTYVNSVRGSSGSGTTLTPIAVRLYQSDSNFSSVEDSPETEFRFQYDTPVTDVAGHRTQFEYHNVVFPRSS